MSLRIATLFAAGLLVACARTPVQSATPPEEASDETHSLEAPESLARDHEEIHERLERITTSGGETGEAASALATILQPHFEREQEVAIPPLALLDELSRGVVPENADEAARLSATLAAELPQMLEEHDRIAEAVDRLERAARDEGRDDAVAFARDLRAHARMEEEVLYPAAVLIGRHLRACEPGA